MSKRHQEQKKVEDLPGEPEELAPEQAQQVAAGATAPTLRKGEWVLDSSTRLMEEEGIFYS